jgi:Na+-driven multidrug efflux pump
MTDTLAQPIDLVPVRETNGALLRQVFALAGPVWVEQVLHMLVGLNDTYLANHLPSHAADAGAAVGTVTYFLWLIGLMVSSIGAGSTALISRAKGARHKSLSNKVTGQSVSASLIVGIVCGVLLFLGAEPIVRATQLQGMGSTFALSYLRMLSTALPFTMVTVHDGDVYCWRLPARGWRYADARDCDGDCRFGEYGE